MKLSETQHNLFLKQGFLVVSNFYQADKLASLQQASADEFRAQAAPIELEAATGYPGAPTSTGQTGGRTSRRLLGAYDRHSCFKKMADCEQLATILSTLFSSDSVWLSRTHHNCLMTKAPEFSSDTGWHQDIRYWSFSQPKLISSWLAIGKEVKENGSLSVIPGTHAMNFERDQFDDRQFFSETLKRNQTTLNQAIDLTLEPGDLLLFHCRLLHRANRNRTQQPKLSLVFTFHGGDTKPTENTRSSSITELQIR